MPKEILDNRLVIYTDGGSRGNPGPAAIGVVIKDQSGKTIKTYAETIGEATNNEAEYRAVIFAMQKIKALIGKGKTKNTALLINMDSEFVSSQLKGEYKIKEESLYPFFIKIWNLKQDYAKTEFHYVPREKNKEADKLVNEVLDRSQTNLFETEKSAKLK